MPSGYRRDNKTSTVALSKRQALAQQKKTEKAQRKLSIEINLEFFC